MRAMTDLVLSHAPRMEMLARLAELSAAPRHIACLYFGCIRQAGHYLWAKNGDAVMEAWHREEEIRRIFGGLDGALCWNGRERGRDETEGRAFITHRGGWTALAFWDRSVDRRGACNSAFIATGTLTFAQMVRLARQQWPMVWGRFCFEVVEVDERGRVKT